LLPDTGTAFFVAGSSQLDQAEVGFPGDLAISAWLLFLRPVTDGMQLINDAPLNSRASFNNPRSVG